MSREERRTDDIVVLENAPHLSLDLISGSHSDEKIDEEKATSLSDSTHHQVNTLQAGERQAEIIGADGQPKIVVWTLKEQRAVVRKADFFLLPIFALGFFWMALDRANISGVLTSTILKDTGITQDQINIGSSLLWLGVVLLEIPSNVVLQRVGPHRWIPIQIIIWGLAETLTYKVSSKGGWYAARLFLGLLESGFIPGSLYVLSQWYTRDELVMRTSLFFFGNVLSGAFGSLIAAGCIKLSGKGGLGGWQWIFIIDGVATIATGILALLFLPSSPRHTAGLFRGKGWLSERQADIYLARLEADDPLKSKELHLQIGFRDIWNVLGNWRLWPHLVMCLAGLQAGQGAGAWSGTILKSLGFTSIKANLLLVPGPIFNGVSSIILSRFSDRWDRRGWFILFSAVWTLTGLIALYKLPILSGGNWGFYTAMVVTAAAPSWQSFNVTWVALNARTPAERSITYAVYIGCSNLGGVYGSQVFRASDAPLYRRAWAATVSLGAIWLAFTLLQIIQYEWSNRVKEREWNKLSEEEQEAYKATTSNDPISKRLDERYAL
ncbi:hypothetical protein L198_05923 [Cryptococcus wingfieldii CBS 7118]|uniref:Major facilitator superfamily (MFS) profile domain-containing protein n=1 Tax=Cryptococcus wingfieldii CBS 7118 TaxID=1295528 RepID=A0A1E3IS53_9TREE|nr:hypothetical protein L198_05923 [Cryptococcus wingfieldii CBS 7118]ODN91409.1 hypothetical protein L198_05923 [Cryptococcus wingfieldii CBS 7118]